MSRQPYAWTPQQISRAKRLWQNGEPQHSICRSLGVTRYAFEYARQHGCLRGLRKRSIGGKGVKCKKKYTPTPQEIKKACAKIQKSWTGKETKERWTGRPFGGPIE